MSGSAELSGHQPSLLDRLQATEKNTVSKNKVNCNLKMTGEIVI